MRVNYHFKLLNFTLQVQMNKIKSDCISGDPYGWFLCSACSLKPGVFSINLLLLTSPSFFSLVWRPITPPTFPDEGLWDTFVKHLPPGTFSYTISLDRLRSGVAYEFRVIAVNRFGYGDPSPPSTAMSGNLPHYFAAPRYMYTGKDGHKMHVYRYTSCTFYAYWMLSWIAGIRGSHYGG